MTSALVETDDELLLRMQSGDEEAFVALYRRRQAGLFRFALHMSGSMPVAEDVTQEVFLALLREDCGYDPARGTLSGYLFGIARKLVLRHLERGRSNVALDTDSDDYAQPELAVLDDPLLDLTRREGIDALAARHSGPAPPVSGGSGACATSRKWITPTPRWRWAARSARCVPGCTGRAGCCWKSCIRSGIPGTLLGRLSR